MKIWLLNPPIKRKRPGSIGGIIDSLFYNSPPLGLAYLAAVLEQNGHQVTITDFPVEGLYINDVPELLRQLSPDLVGISSVTSSFPSALLTARAVRNAVGARVPIGIGGPHMSGNPEIIQQHPVFDFGVVGEGELTLRELVSNLAAGRDLDGIAGVVTCRDNELIFGPPRARIDDLDSLPFPARHLLSLRKYRPMPNDEYRRPKTATITSRGCPFLCTFCDKRTFGDKYRSNSPARIVDEMHHLVQEYGIKDLAFVDSTFTPNRKRITGLLDEMERRPPSVYWTCSTRANVLDEEILRRMRLMNCWRIRIAMESGNNEILKSIKKGVTKEEFEHTVRIADKMGFQVKAFFMVGHIGETPETIKETIDFACSIPIKDVTVQINTPIKGTPQYAECHKHGTLLDQDPSRYSFFQPVFIPHGFTSKQLLDAQIQFYRRFYLRPRLFLRHLRDVKGIPDITKYLRAAPLAFNVMVSNMR